MLNSASISSLSKGPSGPKKYILGGTLETMFGRDRGFEL